MSGETIAILSATLVVMAIGTAISLYVGKRKNSEGDWIVGGHQLPLYVIAFTQFATAVGGGALVAHVGIAYSWGFSVFWYKIFAVIAMLIIAMLANWLRKQRFRTIPEVFRRLYGEKPVLIGIISVAVVVVPFGWLATQFVAFAKLFSEMFNAPQVALVIGMAVFSLLFVLPGGLTSVAWTDFFFGVFMLIGSMVIAYYAITRAGGWETIAETAPNEIIEFPSGMAAAGVSAIALWFFSVVPGIITNQLYYQRVFAAKTGKQARQGLYLSAIMVLLSGIYAFTIGVSVRSMNPSLGEENAELAAGWFLTQIPTWVVALFGAFLVATIVSTTGSALQSVVTNLVSDLRDQFIRDPEARNRSRVTVSRWTTVGVTVIAAILSISLPNALDWLVATYAYSASMLAVPLIIGIILKKRHFELPTSSAYVAVLTGVIGCAVAQLAGTTVPYAVYGIGASLVGYCLVLFVQRPYRIKTDESETIIV